MWNRTIPSGEIDLFLTNGKKFFRVRVKRPEEASYTNLSDVAGGDWALGISYSGDHPDQPASQFTVRFLRTADGDGLTPGVIGYDLNVDAGLTFRPLIHPGRHIEIDVAVTSGAAPESGDWRLWLKGEIEDVDWPGNEVSALCMTMEKPLLDAQIEVAEGLGLTDAGEPIEDHIHHLIIEWFNGVVPFRVIGTPDYNVKEPAEPIPVGSLGDYLFGVAKRVAWDLRYLYDDADDALELTFYLPPRDKTVPDLELAVTDVREVAALQTSRKYVRNAIRINYHNRAEVTPVRQDYEDTDAASITEYRRRPIILVEADDSPVDSPANAELLGDALLSDLSTPLVSARYRIPFLPWVEIHDLVAIQANLDHFDYDMSYAVVGVEHHVDAEEDYTILDLHEGAPVGQVLNWIDRGEIPATGAQAEFDVSITHNDGGGITFIVEGNEATAVGTAKGRWSYTDGAGAYTSFDIDAERRGGYTFFSASEVNFWIYVQLQNLAGVWSPTRRVDIPAFLGSEERFHRIDASTFVTGNPDYDVTDEYVTSAGAFDATSWHGFDFPNTIELTKLRAHAYITDDTFGSGMDQAGVSLFRLPDDGSAITALASASNGGPGSPEGVWTTVEDTLSEVIGSSASSYRLGIHVGTGTPPNARLKWVEFGYLGSWR